MENQLQVNAVKKLAIVGEQAGFSLEQMIQLLDSGMSVVGLLDLITWRLDLAQSSPSQALSLSGWDYALGHSFEVAK